MDNINNWLEKLVKIDGGKNWKEAPTPFFNSNKSFWHTFVTLFVQECLATHQSQIFFFTQAVHVVFVEQSNDFKAPFTDEIQ